MARAFLSDDLLEWEAYVSGGRPGSEQGARIYFVCLSRPLERPRFVVHESRDPAVAEAALRRMSEDELRRLLEAAQPLP